MPRTYRYAAPPFQKLGETLNRGLKAKGWSQAHLAEELYVTRGVITDYFAGTKRPESWRLGWIAAILGLSPYELAALAAYSDATRVVEACQKRLWGMTPLEQFITEAHRTFSLAEMFRDFGRYREAKEVLDELILSLQNRWNVERNKQIKREFREIELQAQIQRLECTLILAPRQNIVSEMLPALRGIYSLVDELGDQRHRDIATAWSVDGYYMSGQWKIALDRANQLLNTSNSGEHLAITHRGRLLSYANLGDAVQFAEAEKDVFAALDDGTFFRPNDRIGVLQALAEARALLSYGDPTVALDAVQQELDHLEGGDIERRILQIVQLLHTRLFILTKTTNPDRDQAREILEQLRLVMPAEGIFTYVNDINWLAKLIGIPERL